MSVVIIVTVGTRSKIPHCRKGRQSGGFDIPSLVVGAFRYGARK